MKVNVISNEDVKQILIGTPPNHKHLRMLMQLEEDWCVFSEATIASIVRAYIEIKTHPLKKTIQLKQALLTGQKEDYANYQLLETNNSEEELQTEFIKLLSILNDKSSISREFRE